jgi:O-antigen/teichoic acid export membrane protein
MWTVVIYGVLSLQPKLTGALLGLLYASIFSLEEYGSYGVLIAVLAVLGIGGDFGLPPAILRSSCDRQGDRGYWQTHTSSLVRGSSIVSLWALPLLGGGLCLSWSFTGIGVESRWLLVPLLLLTSFMGRSVEVLGSICRAIERPWWFAVGRAVDGAVTVGAALIAVVLFKGGLVGALLAPLSGRISAAIAYRILLRRDIPIGPSPVNWQAMKEGLAFGLPLVPNRIASWGRQLALRPLLTHLVSMSSVGMFAFASQVATVPMILSSAVDLALSPVYFRKRLVGAEAFRSRVTDFGSVFLAFLFPVWVAAILFCPDLIRITVGGRYLEASQTCTVLLVAAFCRMQHPFIARQIHFLRRTWILPTISVPCAVLSIVATRLFASSHGITAVAWAVAISDLAVFLGLAWAVSRIEAVNFPVPMSLGLMSTLGLLAWYVGTNDIPAVSESTTIAKSVVVALATAISLGAWVWPRRSFIRELMAT